MLALKACCSVMTFYFKKVIIMGWRERKNEEAYTDEEIEVRLKEELRHWYLENGWIRRKYKTSGWKSTLMVVNTVGHLAEAAFHHPDLNVSYAFVIVKLMNHAAKGITNKDFELAHKIEDIIMWQPGKEVDSALEGTPEDPRFKYIKYE
jgi:4a-hydroxytetrahydrobiopterin dehydratase